MNEAAKKRNMSIDILRGFAMILVVLGHNMIKYAPDSQETVLYNIIWILQMPLFILISGYVTRYSKTPENLKSLIVKISKKTVAYLFPWFVWSFLIRGLLFENYQMFDFKTVFNKIDSTYWFLFTIWVITLFFEISNFISNSIFKKNKILISFTTISIYVVLMLLLGLLGIKFGFNFLGIKLNLYYMLFFLAGYIYGYFKDELSKLKYEKIITDIVAAVCTVVSLCLILRINFYYSNDGIFGIVCRFTASITGCIAVSRFVTEICKKSFFGLSLIEFIGKNSLQMYVIHIIVQNLFNLKSELSFFTAQGILFVAFDFALTLLVSCGIIVAFSKNSVLQKLLFGK